MARNCPDCGSQLQDDGVIGWCPQEGCEFRGSVVMKTGKIIRGTDWECPHCKRLNYGAECKECGAEFVKIHS